MVTVYCQMCGKPIKVSPSRVNTKKFCGLKCSLENLRLLAKGRTGEKHQNYVKRVEVSCSVCRKKFLRRETEVGPINICGEKCRRRLAQWRCQNRVGWNNTNFRGGHDEYRGENWAAQRRKTLDRDSHRCQVCGVKSNIVHHKTPFRYFSDPIEANQLSNLMTVCKSCHMKLEFPSIDRTTPI